MAIHEFSSEPGAQSRKSPEFHYQEETLLLEKHPQKLFIGIPVEQNTNENRVALVPNSVKSLTGHGHRIIVESGAGLKSNFTDQDYSEAGAEIVFSTLEVYKAQIILKTAPPKEEESEYFNPGQIIISPYRSH